MNALRAVLVAALTLLAAPALAQQAAAAGGRVRIVVFQFGIAPNDSGHRVIASSFSRALVRALAGDSALHVMSHPRASEDPSRPPGNAQYGILGAMIERADGLRVDLRIADIEGVRVVWRDTSSVTDTTLVALGETARALAGRVHDRLVSRTP